MVSQHTLKVSGGGGVSKHALQVSRPTPKEELEGFGGGWGVSRPTPSGGVSRPTPGGCIPACTEANPPHTHTTDGYCCGWYASYLNAFLSLLLKSPFLDGLEKFVHF